MSFGGGGGGQLTAHTHDPAIPLDGGALAANATSFGLTAGSILYSDGVNIEELPVGLEFSTLTVSSGVPSWSPSVTTYLQDQRNNASDPSSTSIISERITDSSSLLFGKTISDVKLYLYNPLSNTGTATCGLFSSAGVLKHTFWTIDMATLPTTDTGLQQGTMIPYTSLTIAGDCIGIKTDSASTIKCPVQLTDVFDGTASTWANNGVPNTSYDLAFSITVSP